MDAILTGRFGDFMIATFACLWVLVSVRPDVLALALALGMLDRSKSSGDKFGTQTARKSVGCWLFGFNFGKVRDRDCRVVSIKPPSHQDTVCEGGRQACLPGVISGRMQGQPLGHTHRDTPYCTMNSESYIDKTTLRKGRTDR